MYSHSLAFQPFKDTRCSRTCRYSLKVASASALLSSAMPPSAGAGVVLRIWMRRPEFRSR